jgi:catechol-2,3-dioxygenase
LEPINPGFRIGHAHVKVADLERSLAFYCCVLGFEITERMGGEAASLSAGGYHHHIALNTWESAGGPPPVRYALEDVVLGTEVRKREPQGLRYTSLVPREGKENGGAYDAQRDPRQLDGALTVKISPLPHC